MRVLFWLLLSRLSIAIASLAFLLTGNTAAIVAGGTIAMLSSIYSAMRIPASSHKHLNLVCSAIDTLLVFLFVPLFFQAGWEWWFLLGAWLVSSFLIGKSKSTGAS